MLFKVEKYIKYLGINLTKMFSIKVYRKMHKTIKVLKNKKNQKRNA